MNHDMRLKIDDTLGGARTPWPTPATPSMAGADDLTRLLRLSDVDALITDTDIRPGPEFGFELDESGIQAVQA